MKRFLSILLSLVCLSALASPREKMNFNAQWLVHIGDVAEAAAVNYDDSHWQPVTLPRAINENEAFRLDIHQLSDTVAWYRKHFTLPTEAKGRKVIIEFEGARQGVDCYVNGTLVGTHENGVMAFGFDISEAVKAGKDNVIAVRVDNDWNYHERATGQKYQWADKNFNANYGGLTKNVWLHVADKLYQTLPLYSNLATTGTYVYASQMDVAARTATVNVESQVSNETKHAVSRILHVEVIDAEGRPVAAFDGLPETIAPASKAILTASEQLAGLHFWSWGYGYLYRVKSSLKDPATGALADEVPLTTGFRQTRFAEGKFTLNGRVLQLKGFAQRTSNEWPALGMSVPAWLSDYSNHLMVEAGANLVRWMHITPWKQDIESCDRVGLIEAMPAGDSEKNVEGRRWEQRVMVMRDAIIYNRNNPSIIFYECGNKGISGAHMAEMKALRDEFDPHGGRAIGSREMLDRPEAEYGGEMLYINKSADKPLWAMEYCRDEALRKYWDEWSYPYHPEGQGNSTYLSTVTGQSAPRTDAAAYNRNQDQLAIENVRRWYDYYVERPGGGRRSSSGGAKIVFSDTNTHFRGAENYRRSGDVDAMRLPKDAFFAHQVMWDGWVDIEHPRLHIIGHWNYPDSVKKPVYVVANTDSVALTLNGRSLGAARRQWQFLFTFPEVQFEAGTLVATGFNKGVAVCRDTLETAGTPHHLVLTALTHPDGWQADGADLALVEVEVVDSIGRRCPLANDTIHFSIDGPAQWRGGIAAGEGFSEILGTMSTNFILCQNLPVDCGVNRVLLRSLTSEGRVTLTAQAQGLQPATLTLQTAANIHQHPLPCRLTRGETPRTPSYTDRSTDIPIARATAGANGEQAMMSYDDNERTEWKNDGRLSTAFITYHFARPAVPDELCLKLTGWRMRSYPLEVYADTTLVWSGNTEPSLGYIHLNLTPTKAQSLTIRLKGAAAESHAFEQITELAQPAEGELDLYKAKEGNKVKGELRIVEAEIKE